MRWPESQRKTGSMAMATCQPDTPPVTQNIWNYLLDRRGEEYRFLSVHERTPKKDFSLLGLTDSGSGDVFFSPFWSFILSSGSPVWQETQTLRFLGKISAVACTQQLLRSCIKRQLYHVLTDPVSCLGGYRAKPWCLRCHFETNWTAASSRQLTDTKCCCWSTIGG